MTDEGLLPEGFRDCLPNDAQLQMSLRLLLMQCIADRGYEIIDPPLVEFADKMDHGFLFMDPQSSYALRLRSDITPQIGRIATHRLGQWARPLRLAYAGQVLRTRGTVLDARRQFTQLGAELIGNSSAPAVLELITLATDCLKSIAAESICLNLLSPNLLTQLGRRLKIDDQRLLRLQDLFDTRDEGLLSRLGLPEMDLWRTLFAANGSLEHASKLLEPFCQDFPELKKILDLGQMVQQAQPKLSISMSLGESHGFAFQTWVGFSLFAGTPSQEIIKGGTYYVGEKQNNESEEAVGFSLYLDRLLQTRLDIQRQNRCLIAAQTDEQAAKALRNQGYATVRSLDPAETVDATKARTLRCSHYLNQNGKACPVEGKS